MVTKAPGFMGSSDRKNSHNKKKIKNSLNIPKIAFLETYWGWFQHLWVMCPSPHPIKSSCHRVFYLLISVALTRMLLVKVFLVINFYSNVSDRNKLKVRSANIIYVPVILYIVVQMGLCGPIHSPWKHQMTVFPRQVLMATQGQWVLAHISWV